MFKLNKILWVLVICVFISIPSICSADEADIFASPDPDALFIVDLSGSMRWVPAGPIMYMDKNLDPSNCTADAATYNGPFYDRPDSLYSNICGFDSWGNIPIYSNSSCSGPFYKSQTVSGYTTDCSKVAIVKRAIFSLLDSNADDLITSADETDLKVRLGYMRFYNCGGGEIDEIYNYALGNGCNYVIEEIGTKYSNIYCNSDTQCLISDTCSSADNCANYNGTASGNTPEAGALIEAKLYLDANNSADSAEACRQKFAILITDGSDTTTCWFSPGSLGGDTHDFHPQMYARRRATVAKAKALADAGYKVIVVGFSGNAPYFLKNTLNWAAYYGGTDNPLVANFGNTSGYIPNDAEYCQFYGDILDSDSVYTTPGTNVVCKDVTTGASCKASIQSTEGQGCYCYVTANDPGEAALDGYAFIATNPSDLLTALKQAIGIIREGIYSFSGTSVAASRTTVENYIYEASFTPRSNEPFWLGHLKKYSLNSDGSIGSTAWDAGLTLQSRDPATRNVFTYRAGALYDIASEPPGQLKTYLDVGTGTAAMDIVGYIKGDPNKNPDGWKLGDAFHSNAVVIGSPSIYYADPRSPRAFIDFRNSYQGRERLLVVGANDGQLHAFQAGSSNGSEKWSFIPPNLQAKLKYLVHFSHPTSLGHTYFVDGPLTAADVWLGSGDGTNKVSRDWHTLLVFGEGRGVRDSLNNASNTKYLWSSSSSCDDNLNPSYTTNYNKYCGYYALDITDTSASLPTYKWHINLTDAANQGPYLGEPWSKMAVGRVKIGGSEKWVGFIGGGYNATSGVNPGRGFFVIDLNNGDILWSYTKSNNSSMTYSIPASPAVVDTDNDGFIDTAYVGDLGGNMWRFKFCTNADASTCGTNSWSGGKLFDSTVGSGTIRPIYTTAAVTKDASSLWVLWGTGDKANPVGNSGTDHFFALKDNDRSTTRSLSSDFQDISTTGTTYSGVKAGWYITLGGTGETMLYDPAVFGGIALFTTYIPTAGANPCDTSGTSKLYAIALMRIAIGGNVYDPGAGVLSAPSTPGSTAGGARSVTLGSGMAKTPLFSQKPLPGGGATDLYISLSGGSGQDTTILSSNSSPISSTPLAGRLADTAASSQLMQWKDGRVQ